MASMAPATSLTTALPVSTRMTAVSISSLISCDAAAERLASARTSSATTAKPLPCSPARAASTAAFKASRLVWKATSLTVAVISRIWLAAWVMASMAVAISRERVTFWLTRSMAPAALRRPSSALPAAALIELVISSMVAAISSTLAACSVALWASCSELLLTSALPAETSSAVRRMRPTNVSSCPDISCMALASWPISSSCSISSLPRRSPCATALTNLTLFCMPLEIERESENPSQRPKARTRRLPPSTMRLAILTTAKSLGGSAART
ncbi:MAG: hypothetical protein BWY87_01100 [Deltaproteobacteria bacterium ADurb.Bin510]|nr:MAG: hypothetical protein BWY87_01100 [Deltaproteobacteria bacterium ADurb.Bin510]